MCGHDTTPASPERQRAELPIRVHGSDKPASCDPCLRSMVQALNDGGLATAASCCGHGILPGRVTLRDGSELMIVPDWETADRLWRRWEAS